MSEKDNFALARRPTSAVERAELGAKRILSDMVAGTLALANRDYGSPTKSRFRIGEYEWCEPDYRQILIWAKVLGLSSGEVIRRLLKGGKCVDDSWYETRFSNGRLLKINWDLKLLPVLEFELIEGLKTTHLCLNQDYVKRPRIRMRNLRLPHLTPLEFNQFDVGAEGCDLSGVPSLIELECGFSQIRELDLRGVPRLQKLGCLDNRLSKLDLSAVPNLIELACGDNQISEVDISKVPRLQKLYCYANRLSGLGQSGVSHLTHLWCGENEIGELDLSKMPNLEYLNCASNRLSNLDLVGVPMLKRLFCEKNNLGELDLSGATELEVLDCMDNAIDVLDISPLFHLRELKYDVGTTRLLQRQDQHF